ncbi:hypothetical protein L3V59_42135 (plasmid) [Burkholderia aenigmatica]|uniref:hypothetical protein n=1 Tax=Burkholderia aenigmatica TaxID=2015348 RepID=UPI001F1CBF4E|nr:hypothetical protein [Burkholderia aenigmatica]UKD18078.1 hypothetical protein L3V59_42135 [Burkholderia aenigmatica]
MTSRTHNDGDVLLDDGIYFIESDPAPGQDGRSGCLMRRCDRGSPDAGAAECVGIYELTVDAKWRVAIMSYYDARTDSETHEIGAFENRLDAICTLWKSRHDAIGRYAN